MRRRICLITGTVLTVPIVAVAFYVALRLALRTSAPAQGFASIHFDWPLSGVVSALWGQPILAVLGARFHSFGLFISVSHPVWTGPKRRRGLCLHAFP